MNIYIKFKRLKYILIIFYLKLKNWKKREKINAYCSLGIERPSKVKKMFVSMIQSLKCAV